MIGGNAIIFCYYFQVTTYLTSSSFLLYILLHDRFIVIFTHTHNLIYIPKQSFDFM